MTLRDKVLAFQTGISPETAENDVIEAQLRESEGLILNRMYPFGYPDGTTVPARYEQLEVKLAIELYTQRGAEGQSSHGENGTTRTWPIVNQTLAQIVPHVGSVIRNA